MMVDNFKDLSLKRVKESEINELVSKIGSEEDIHNFLRAALESDDNHAINQLFESIHVDWNLIEFMIHEGDFRLIEMAEEYGYYPTLEQMLRIINIADFTDAINLFKLYLKTFPDEDDIREIFKNLEQTDEVISLKDSFKQIVDEDLPNNEITEDENIDDNDDYNSKSDNDKEVEYNNSKAVNSDKLDD